MAIEVNGDYFHSHPLKYPTLINEMQKNNIIRDKRKRTYLKRYGKNVKLSFSKVLNLDFGKKVYENFLLQYNAGMAYAWNGIFLRPL